MSFLNTNSFQDRQQAAAKARQAMAEKFLSRPKYEQLRLEAEARAAEEEAARAELERLEFEKKLERDARYAARKDRKLKKKSAGERWG